MRKTTPIPDTLGICHLCFEPVWADQSYIFIEGGRPVHKICHLRQPESYRQNNLPEGSPFVNEWKKGRTAWRCSKCGKGLWLDPGVYEKAYRDSEVCLDCRALMKRMDEQRVCTG
ncbi:hypothetical protein SAMN02745133_03093 [Desulforamulus putei DSM 12395]|uniref:Uncharacterized protein n=1 Tax=Desulforamulus putei DSM 12395 TaxID=1121429 RepID=A0A1M5D2H6_9FIRM|nr:hypothetical protein [Desulforamulus putei]SHF61239.1 hypothetical protein SAMN02745133_03093 [Desulforamulus putei DSM 12395]